MGYVFDYFILFFSFVLLEYLYIEISIILILIFLFIFFLYKICSIIDFILLVKFILGK